MSVTSSPAPFGTALAEAVEIRRRSRLIASEARVRAALDRIARGAAAVLSNQNPLILAVMQGGVFTAVELCRRMDFPHQFDFVHVTRYGHSLSGGELSWRALPSLELRGRTVLLVDDILDRGVTLAALHGQLAQLGVGKLWTAVLVSKNVAASADRVAADFIGFQVEDAYVFGCGMDYKGYWRGLKSLYAVESP